MKLYISVNGCDTNPGTADAPLASVIGARDKIRSVKETGITEPITVVIGPGEYNTPAIVFDDRDSGTASCPITYEADGEVILNGGVTLASDLFVPLTDEEKARLHGDAKERVVRCDLTKLGLTRADWGEMCVTGSHNTGSRYDGAVLSPMWCELFVNDVRQTVARYPNRDFLYSTEPIREGRGLESPGSVKKMTMQEWAQVRNPLSDIYGIDADTAKRAAAWKTLDEVWMFGYPVYNWADMSSPVVRIDAETCEMETQMVSMFGMKPHAPYYFYNVFEELDAPGEWYLDRASGWLYLYPPAELSASTVNLSILSESVLTADGVSHLHLRGITFTGTRADAVTLIGDHLSVENCCVKNVAGYAYRASGTHITIRGCEIHHTGKGGIEISGGDRASLTSSENVVEYNHIHDTAEIFKTYTPGVNMQGVGIVCRNNTIHDIPHMAIGFFTCNDCVMEYNEIYNCCQFADDSGAIYSGRDYSVQGNVIRRNYFHDMKSDAENHIGIFGVYCDDNLGGCEITQNIFERCQSAMLLHGGHDMIFRGNVIADACPKSVYSVRFHGYGYWDDLLPGGLHDQALRRVPWQSEVWQKAYPHLSDYLTWDAETEGRYPHFGDLSGNVIINHKPFDCNFPWDDVRFGNRMENNTFLEARPAGSTEALVTEILPKTVPGFEAIPFAKIGCGK